MVAAAPLDSSPESALEALEAEISELAGHLAAGTSRLIGLIGEHDRRGGYATHGLASTAHWLSWRCGTGLHAAREQVRVARALPALPGIRAAFARGAISFSKVRAMTRAATPDNETCLLELARYGTAAQLERLLSRCRRAGLGVEHMRRHARRYVRWHEDEDGMLVIRASLPAESGALVVQAIEAAADILREEEYANVSAETDAPGAVHEGSNETLDDGSRRHAHVPSDPDDVPAETWAVCDAESPYIRRHADALCRVAESFLASGPKALAGAERYQVNVHVSAADLAGDGGAEIDRAGKLTAATMRRIGCDASFLSVLEDEDGSPLNIGRRTRSIPAALRRALEQRDGGCRFPGCTRRRWVDAHHIHHWADGGETRLENLVLLCRYHHRLIHEGGFAALRGRNGVVFRKPDGEPIARDPLHGDVAALVAGQRHLDIDATTIYRHGCGERMDLHAAASLLFERTCGTSSEAPARLS